jgi:hypothetical protein
MPDFRVLLARISGSLDASGVPFMIIGGQAVLVIAGRPRDLEDAAGVVRRRGNALEWRYIRRWAQDLAEAPGREGLPDDVEALREHL